MSRTLTLLISFVFLIGCENPAEPPASNAGTVLWTRPLNHGVQILASLALAPGGPLYVGTNSGLLAVSREGEPVRTMPVSGPLWDGPGGVAVDPDGTVYALSMYDTVYAFSPTGSLLWKRTIVLGQTRGRFAIADDGSLFLNGTTGNRSRALVRLEPATGDTVWAISRNSSSADVVFNPLAGLSIVFGDTLMQISASGSVNRRMLISEEGGVRIAAGNAVGDLIFSSGLNLVAVDSAGKRLWKLPAEVVWSHPVIDADGNVYAVGHRNDQNTTIVQAVTRDGSRLWQRSLGPSGLFNSAALVEGRTLYVGSGTVFYALSTMDGSTLWTIPLDATVVSAVAVSEDGQIYFVTRDATTWEGNIVAVDGDVPLANQSPWPAWRADNQQTARVHM